MASLTERMTGAMQADVKTFQEIEADPAAISQAVTVIVIAGVASLLGNMFRIGIIHGAPTYEVAKATEREDDRWTWMMTPAEAGQGYLDLYDATTDEKYLAEKRVDIVGDAA